MILIRKTGRGKYRRNEEIKKKQSISMKKFWKKLLKAKGEKINKRKRGNNAFFTV